MVLAAEAGQTFVINDKGQGHFGTVAGIARS
jgi:hypothetical protein